MLYSFYPRCIIFVFSLVFFSLSVLGSEKKTQCLDVVPIKDSIIHIVEKPIKDSLIRCDAPFINASLYFPFISKYASISTMYPQGASRLRDPDNNELYVVLERNTTGHYPDEITGIFSSSAYLGMVHNLDFIKKNEDISLLQFVKNEYNSAYEKDDVTIAPLMSCEINKRKWYIISYSIYNEEFNVTLKVDSYTTKHKGFFVQYSVNAQKTSDQSKGAELIESLLFKASFK